MLMSRRYWSSEPSSDADFLFDELAAIRPTRAMGDLPDDDIASAHPLAEASPANAGEPRRGFRAVWCIAVIHDERPTAHVLGGDEPPVAAVLRVVAIVAQREVLPSWDDQRAPVVTSRMITESGRLGGADEIVPLPAELVVARVEVGIGVHHVRLAQRDAVPHERPFPHGQCIAGEPDEPLHV